MIKIWAGKKQSSFYRPGSVRLMVIFDDLGSLFQPELLCDSMTLNTQCVSYKFLKCRVLLASWREFIILLSMCSLLTVVC